MAICELDAGLAIFPGSALLNALRACAGMIAGRSSGPDILRYYRGQTINGMRWEEIIFDQLDRVRRAPGVIQIVGDVELILGSTRPSARERRNTRVSIMHAAPGMFPTRIDDEAEEARDRDLSLRLMARLCSLPSALPAFSSPTDIGAAANTTARYTVISCTSTGA